MTEFTPLAGGPDAVGLWLAETLIDSELARPRTLQASVGPSELGHECARALSYKLAGADRIAFSDPLKAIIGTGFHGLMEKALSGNPRYLTEVLVTYRGIRGSVDLFDLWHGRCIDYKTATLSKIKRIKFKGVPEGHRVQIQAYAAGLQELGLNVRSATLLYVPTDGTLADIYAATLPVNRAAADEAIDRLESLKGSSPQDVPPTVTPLCGWCSYYRPNTPLDSRGCPGGTLGSPPPTGGPSQETGAQA